MSIEKVTPNTIPAPMEIYSSKLLGKKLVRLVSPKTNVQWTKQAVHQLNEFVNGFLLDAMKLTTSGDGAGRYTFRVAGDPNSKVKKLQEDREVHVETVDIFFTPERKNGQKSFMRLGSTLLDGAVTVFVNFGAKSWKEAKGTKTETTFLAVSTLTVVFEAIFKTASGKAARLDNGDIVAEVQQLCIGYGFNPKKVRLITNGDFLAKDSTKEKRVADAKERLAPYHDILANVAEIMPATWKDSNGGGDGKHKLSCTVTECKVNSQGWTCKKDDIDQLRIDLSHDGKRDHELVTS